MTRTTDEYVFFENTHRETDEDGNEIIAIDGYPIDPNASGAVIANVIKTPHNDIVTVWNLNAYRLNATVLALIENSKNLLKES